MIQKIISGGQTGVDRAALDAAIRLGIAHGGWVPKDRKTENGPLPDTYDLKEMPTAEYAARTERNVIESDGTVILSHGELTGGSDYTRSMAVAHKRPLLHVDLNRTPAFQAAQEIAQWIRRHGVSVLNVAGPRASKDPDIYAETINIIESVFYLDVMSNADTGPSSGDAPLRPAPEVLVPKTVDAAVDLVIGKLSLKERAAIARMPADSLDVLQYALAVYLRNDLGLGAGNTDLLNDCRWVSHTADLDEAGAVNVLARSVRDRLVATHRLRLVKS